MPVRVAFHSQDGEVVGVTLTAEPAESSVPVNLLARGLGLECAPLPEGAAVTRFEVTTKAERLLLTGSGECARLAVLCRESLLLVTEFQDRAGQSRQIVSTDRDLTEELVAAAAAVLAARGVPVPALAGGLPAERSSDPVRRAR